MSNNQDQNFKHQNKYNLCYYTNELYPREEIVCYEMKNRGYGSLFDSDVFIIQLHKAVAKELDCKGILCKEWFNNEKMMKETSPFCCEYDHEEDIHNFIKGLIPENREYIENCNNWLLGSIDREDWIRENK